MATSDGPRSVPDITLQATRGASVPSEPTVDPVISSVTDNGDTLTITGSNFGSKAQAAPVFWDFGLDTRLNGQSVTPPSVGDTAPSSSMWRAVDGVAQPSDNYGVEVVNDAPRHAGVSAAYRAYGKGWIGGAEGYPETAQSPGNKRSYLAYWIKPGCIFAATRLYSDVQVTGTPLDSPIRQVGESCDIYDGATLVDSDAFILHYVSPNSIATFSRKPTATLTALEDLLGKTAIGRESGAEIFIPLTAQFASCGSVKHARTFNGSSIGSPGTAYSSVSRVNGGFTFLRVYDENGNDVSGGGYINGGLAPIEAGQWELFEQIVDISDPQNGFVELRVNGSITGRLDGIPTAAATSAAPIIPTNLGLDTPGCFSSADVGFGMDWGEIYMDNSLCRVYLSNGGAPELQRITNWSDTEITVVKNLGAVTGSYGVSVANAAGESGFVGVA